MLSYSQYTSYRNHTYNSHDTYYIYIPLPDGRSGNYSTNPVHTALSYDSENKRNSG